MYTLNQKFSTEYGDGLVLYVEQLRYDVAIVHHDTASNITVHHSASPTMEMAKRDAINYANQSLKRNVDFPYDWQPYTGPVPE